MTVRLPGGPRRGEIRAPASKSAAQRLFLLAALGQKPCEIACGELSDDLSAMLRCLSALGAAVSFADGRVAITPIRSVGAGELRLPCGESGTALRFLLPLVGALGAEAVFEREGRLPERPIAPLVSELCRHGMTIASDGALLRCSGRLRGGDWTLPGDLSSQFVSALLLALPLLDDDSTLSVAGPLVSAPYAALTEQTLRSASIRFSREGPRRAIPGRQRPALPSFLSVEGDWSAAAVFLAMGALSGEGVSVSGLDPLSAQGDRLIVELLRAFGAEVASENDRVSVRRKELRGLSFDASQTPDLVPVIAALGALAEGETRIEHAARLRGKESDRLYAAAAMLSALGADAKELPDGLLIRGGGPLPGGAAACFSDHRIAMAAAVAACGCDGPVTLAGAESVGKSYPSFWHDFASLEFCDEIHR